MKYPVQLRTKVSPEDLEIIRRNAETADISVCAYLRECATRRKVQGTVDVRMLAELRRIGGMVKQLWIAGRGDEASTIQAGLDAIRKAVETAQAARERAE